MPQKGEILRKVGRKMFQNRKIPLDFLPFLGIIVSVPNA